MYACVWENYMKLYHQNTYLHSYTNKWLGDSSGFSAFYSRDSPSGTCWYAASTCVFGMDHIFRWLSHTISYVTHAHHVYNTIKWMYYIWAFAQFAGIADGLKATRQMFITTRQREHEIIHRAGLFISTVFGFGMHRAYECVWPILCSKAFLGIERHRTNSLTMPKVRIPWSTLAISWLGFYKLLKSFCVFE